jgi:hypothetical protein
MKNGMNMAKSFLWGVLSVGVVLCSVSTARSEEIPEYCSQDDSYGAKTRAYNAGALSGENLVSMMWSALREDCDRIELLESIAVSNLQRFNWSGDESDVVACRFAGYANGILAKIDELYRYCEKMCYLEGQMIGEIAAIAYCELSLAFGGLVVPDGLIRAPVQICGLQFEFACDSTFIDITFSYENILGACFIYAFDTYFEVWNQTRNNQCAYYIVEPPTETSVPPSSDVCDPAIESCVK